MTQELEDEGVKAFADAFTQLLATIDERRKNAASSLGPLADSVSKRIVPTRSGFCPARLWKHDPFLWAPAKDKAGQHEVTIRMGWLDLHRQGAQEIERVSSLCQRSSKKAKIDRVLVLGMGGSSLTAEVFSSLMAAAEDRSPVVARHPRFDRPCASRTCRRKLSAR